MTAKKTSEDKAENTGIQESPVKVDVFDLDNLTEKSTVRHRVVLATDDDGREMGVFIVGRDSEQYEGVRKASNSRAVKAAMRRTKDSDIERTVDEAAKTAMEAEIDTALAVTVEWFGVQRRGVPQQYDYHDMRRIYQARHTWVEKVLAALNQDRNFT